MPKVAVAMVPRDHFSKSAKVLSRVLDDLAPDQRLFIVDNGTPPRYRKAMERLVRGRRRVEWLRSEEWLSPNAAKNWVFREASDAEYVAWTENDTLVPHGWATDLLRACEAEQAEVARPMVLENKMYRTFPHFDPGMGHIERIGEGEDSTFRFVPRDQPVAADVGSPRRLTTVLEAHCVLMSQRAHRQIGGLDETLSTREALDLALQLFDAGIRTVFEPAVEVTFMAPPPVYSDERAYYLDRWDIERARESNRHVERKWGFREFPHSVEFVRFRHEHVSRRRYLQYFARWELSHWLRYGAYRAASHLPDMLRSPIHRALYG